MAPVVLGLDIGGANLKAATADKRAVSVPFALWKQPDRLPAALAGLVGEFPDATELAVTMTGELCDCYETKRQGVNAILDATELAAGGRPVRVWSTDGAFVSVADARQNHLKVAAANWHALATFAGRFMPEGPAVLIDVGSTTTDVIPLLDGLPVPRGKTDPERLEQWELMYAGVRRTPVAYFADALPPLGGLATELFATAIDAHLYLGLIPENPDDFDTADGRPATKAFAFDRLCRVYCGDRETITRSRIDQLADQVIARHISLIVQAAMSAGWHLESILCEQFRDPRPAERPPIIASGAGEYLVNHTDPEKGARLRGQRVLSLSEQLGPTVSACAPAYALAVLATERRP